MVKKHICDACLKVIDDPYQATMRTFYIGMEIDEFGIWPCNARYRQKIDICGDCITKFLKFVRGDELEKEKTNDQTYR